MGFRTCTGISPRFVPPINISDEDTDTAMEIISAAAKDARR